MEEAVKNLQKNRKEWDIEKKVLFIAVFLSSMTGAQFMGVSLAKISLIPFELMLLSRFSLKIRISKVQRMMIGWYVITIFSCMLSFLYSVNLDGFTSKIMNLIIQIVIMYIPITLLIGKTENIGKKFIDCIVITAKINTAWALVQFICWYGMRIDINDLIFNGVLKGVLGTRWTCWMYETGSLAIRVSGFNYDTAYLSVLLIFGVIFEKKWLWKTTFLAVSFLTMSRSGIITVSLFYLFLLVKVVCRKKINYRKLLYSILGGGIIVGLSVYLISSNTYVQYQINLVFQRMINITSGGTVGTTRHILYPIAALKVWFNDYNIIQKIFGIGPRVGGAGFAISTSLNNFIGLTDYMNSSAWAVECDIAEILLGNGVLGMMIYMILIKLHRQIKNSLEWGGISSLQ